MKPLKVLFAGLGSIGQRHLRNLQQICGDHLDVSAYRVRGDDAVLTDKMQIGSTKGLKEKFHVREFKDLSQALAAKPDVVFVTNPTSVHMNVALEAARNGCHLFVDKPLSHEWDGVDELISLLKKSGKVGAVGYQLRWHPAFQKIQRWLKSKSIGPVVAVRAQVAEYMPAFHPYEDYRGTYAAKQELGGGCILTQIHEFDYLYALFGLPLRIFTSGGHWSSLEIDVEDVASSLMDYQDRQGRRFLVQLHQDYLQKPSQRDCLIIGENGKIVWDLLSQTLVRYDAAGKAAESENWPAFERNQLFLDQTKHFLDCIDGKASPLVSIEEGAQSLRMALAAKRSLATGQPVDVAEVLA